MVQAVTIEELDLALEQGELIQSPPIIEKNYNRENLTFVDTFNSVEFRNQIDNFILPLNEKMVTADTPNPKDKENDCDNSEEDMYNKTMNNSSVNTHRMLELLRIEKDANEINQIQSMSTEDQLHRNMQDFEKSDTNLTNSGSSSREKSNVVSAILILINDVNSVNDLDSIIDNCLLKKRELNSETD